jgi:hypothetical protein
VLQKLFDQMTRPGETDFQGVFHHQWQQLCGWPTAVDGIPEAGGQQVREPSVVIDMDMREQQALDPFQREFDFRVGVFACVVALKNPTIHQQAV